MRSVLLSTCVWCGVLGACSSSDPPTAPLQGSSRSPSPSASAQAAEHLVFQEPISFAVSNPCTGEVLTFSGQMIETIAICRKVGDIAIYKLITEDDVKDVTLLRKGTL